MEVRVGEFAFGIRQLVDIGERTLSHSSRDSSTAREVVQLVVAGAERSCILDDDVRRVRTAETGARSS